MWVANAGEATVSKIDTNTGREVGRYRTFFSGGGGPWSGPAPSRTSVNADGDVFVLNRHFEGKRPQVMKILATGGIDRNGNGVIDTAADTNGNGVIDGGEMKPLVDTNGNGAIDPNEIQDERVVWAAVVGNPNTLGRSLCTGADGNLWVGTWQYTPAYYKVSSSNGAVLAGPYNTGIGNYGCLVDSSGILWSASLGDRLGKLNTATGAVSTYTHWGQDYGIAIGNGKVYQSSLSGRTYSEFDPSTNTFTYPAWSKGIGVGGISVSVDGNGNIFVTQQYGGVRKFKPDGTQIWFAPNQGGMGENRGAIVDSNGDLWVNHLWNNRVSKFRGTDGAALGVFPVGANPYTYSDATGLVAVGQTTPTGFWTVINDGGSAGMAWSSLDWNATVPPGATLEFYVRAADTQAGLDTQNYEQVNSPINVNGRYIQIRVKLVASPSGQTPVVHDLTVHGGPLNNPPAANAGGPYSVPEGGSTTLAGSGSDPDPGDTLTYDWDLDNDGSFETAGQNPVFSAAGRDGPTSQVVTLRVTDSKGASATSNATVNIVNAAPTANAGSDAVIYSGQTLNLAGGFSDPGSADGVWQLTFRWGDGSTSSGSSATQGAGTATGSHQYFAPGTYGVEVCVTDKDAGQGCDQMSLQVARLPVRIDIKPGSFPNSINLGNKGNVPVGVFTGEYEGVNLDATAIVRSSVRFAGAPDLGIGKSPQDLDGDGDLDQVFHFDTPALSGLSTSSTQGCLTGQTSEDVYFQGCDSVRIVKGN